MARKRRRNPGVGTLLGLVVLGVGGYVVYDKFIKEDKKKTEGATGGTKALWPPPFDVKRPYAINADCTLREQKDLTEAQQKIVVDILFSSLASIGGHGRITPHESMVDISMYDPNVVELDLLDVLGPPPGEPTNNIDFARAWASAAFAKMVHPACLKTLGLSANFAKETNSYGADFTEADTSEWPPDVVAYLESLYIGISMIMQFGRYEMGYDEGLSAAMPSPVRMMAGG